MKTIFLASGQSSRMNPISDKNLLEFCGEPLVLKLLKNAEEGGLKNFIVVTNKDNHDEIKNILSENNFSAEITIQKDLNEGMAGGITDGLEFVSDSDSVFVLGGNDFVEPRIYDLIVKKSKDFDGGILAKKVDQYFPGGYLEINKYNKITSIIEKPGKGNEPSDLVNIIGHFFKNAGDIKTELKNADSTKDDVYEVALDQLFQTKNFIAVEYNDIWQAIKYPWHVLEMMNVFLDKQEGSIAKSAEIAKSATIKGDNVVIDDGAKIFENAVIIGPCYIGKNAVVGNNALVRNSILGESSVAGYNTEIARSFLANNVTTHIAYLGDSIVDSNVNFGAYSCTANLRLDKRTVQVKVKMDKVDSLHKKLGAIVGSGAQIGIHAKIMPGAKIKKDGFIKPGNTAS
ncbi:MAG: sugar phosphate nucleotidyltransferase [Candidatus Peregrinibacteria bacterium]|nr:sugar phosphate nucleotidyltransferase [Candidatus Peregrinibacteria bacterium]